MIEEGPIIKYHNQKEDISAYPPASFAARALAFFIDAMILGAIQASFAAFYDLAITKMAPPVESYFFFHVLYAFLNAIALPSLYFIPQIRRSGQTIGKKVLRIRIVGEDNTEKLGPGRIFLREIIGKFVSAVFFGAGYMMRLFGLDTFHDKMAKTKVISLKVLE